MKNNEFKQLSQVLADEASACAFFKKYFSKFRLSDNQAHLGLLREIVAVLATLRQQDEEQTIKKINLSEDLTKALSCYEEEIAKNSLYKLVSDGCIAGVLGKLLSTECSLHSESQKLYAALCSAVLKNNTLLAELFIHRGVNVNINKERQSLLHIAVENANITLVNILIQNGANVNAQDDRGQTPLHLASALRKSELVLCLLNVGAKTSIVDDKLCTPLQYAKEDVIIKELVQRMLAEAVITSDPNACFTQIHQKIRTTEKIVEWQINTSVVLIDMVNQHKMLTEERKLELLKNAVKHPLFETIVPVGLGTLPMWMGLCAKPMSEAQKRILDAINDPHLGWVENFAYQEKEKNVTHI